MKEKETVVKEISGDEMKEIFLSEFEVATSSLDTIGEYFTTMRGRVENDDSPENYFMIGFKAGFQLARSIESEFNSMAIINTSRKLHGES